MKYLHDDALTGLTARLTDCPVSNSGILQGRLEAFTMKRTASDKRYVFNNLKPGTESNKQAAPPVPSRARSKSVPEDPTSLTRFRGRRAVSVDETNDDNDYLQRRLLTDLILTLNLSFCDYDFGTAAAGDFGRHRLQTVVGFVNRRLGGPLGSVFLSELWSGIDSVINLSQVTTVYSYADTEAIPNLLGGENYQNLWSFNYFFVNKTAKRILLFTCVETLGNKRRESIGGAIPSAYSFGSVGGQSTGPAHLLNTSADEDSESVDFDLDPAESISVPVRPV